MAWPPLPPTGSNFCRSPTPSRATSRSTSQVVLTAMEEAMQRAAKAHYGSENDIKVDIDPKTGETHVSRYLHVVELVENDKIEISPGRCARAQSRRPGRRHHRRDPAAGRFQPHQCPERQAGDRAEGARCRARAPV